MEAADRAVDRRAAAATADEGRQESEPKKGSEQGEGAALLGVVESLLAARVVWGVFMWFGKGAVMRGVPVVDRSTWTGRPVAGRPAAGTGDRSAGTGTAGPPVHFET